MISSFRLFVTCVVVALALLLALPVLTVLFLGRNGTMHRPKF